MSDTAPAADDLARANALTAQRGTDALRWWARQLRDGYPIGERERAAIGRVLDAAALALDRKDEAKR